MKLRTAVRLVVLLALAAVFSIYFASGLVWMFPALDMCEIPPHSGTSSDTGVNVTFVIAGSKSDYRMHNIPKWIAATTGRIQIIRDTDAIFKLVSAIDRESLQILSKNHVHVVTADFMKFVVHYYQSGIVTVPLTFTQGFRYLPCC